MREKEGEKKNVHEYPAVDGWIVDSCYANWSSATLLPDCMIDAAAGNVHEMNMVNHFEQFWLTSHKGLFLLMEASASEKEKQQRNKI